MDTRNEHALIHCLVTPERFGIKRETIVELQCSLKNESLTIYQVLLSFLRRKELVSTRISSLQHANTDPLDKFYDGLKEFFDFIEQLRMIIEENEQSKTESR